MDDPTRLHPPLTRRAFLAHAVDTTTATLGLAALGDLALVAAGRREAAAGPPRAAHEVHLEARETTWELAPGRTIKVMAYNGRVPGPEIRVREGERIRVLVTNALGEPTTVHWHGVAVPNPMDGVPGVTQAPVPPGRTFVYEFEARPAGTRWYHTHLDEHRQLDLGLAGPFVIEAAAPEPMAADREVTLVLDDWVTGQGPPVPPTSAGIAGVRGNPGGMMGRMGGMMGAMGGMVEGMMGRSDAPPYDTMTINGKAYPATEPLRLRKGERVRLRLISVSNEHTHLVRLTGHRLHVTHTDGNPLRAPVDVDAIPIAPSERYDAVVVAARPGAWLFECLAPGHADAGERLLVRYDGFEGREPERSAVDPSALDVWQYGRGRGRAILPAPWGAARGFDLTLSGGMGGSTRWTINGKAYPDADPLHLREGDLAQLRFLNMSPESHPMHLHGQSFRVVAVNGARYAEPLVKDTVDVDPHMGSVVIAFTAANPGDWLLHCHKPMHMDGGMMTLVKIPS